MEQRKIEQIKIFTFENYKDVEFEVNKYVIEFFEQNENYPRIEITSKFIAVIGYKLI